ncbi:MAG: M48 family metalloprotease [Bacteroidetes bacterium]|nr:M48 family metalloprotease [Bacteroidota bacterium]
MRIVILFLVLHFSLIIYAQDFNNYTPILSDGSIPDDFLGRTSDKVESDRNKIGKDEKSSTRRLKNEYLLVSNYNIDQILSSGLVSFNDPLAEYVGKVADKILEKDPELRSELRFYTLRSTEVNAYATNKGIILVSTGLLAELKNEAQLAFILSHEIIHYRNKHNIEGYVEQSQIIRGKGDYRGTSRDDRISSVISYSHEQEKEADEQGFRDYYEKSGYSLEDATGVCDVLLYSYLPIEELAFNKDFFETENLKFPDEYVLKEIDPITAIEDYDDSKSSHPNIKKRREYIHRKVELSEVKQGRHFMVSEEEFYRVRKIARFELCSIYLTWRRYGEAIYNSFVLLRDDPNSKYLRSIIGTSLYALAKYTNLRSQNKVLTKYTKVEGNSQPLYYFLGELQKRELNILALHYLWRLKTDFPEDVYIEAITKDAFRELVFEHNASPDEFRVSSIEEFTELTDEEVTKLDKYEKIKYMKKLERIKKGSNTVDGAFAEFIEKKDFLAAFYELAEEWDSANTVKDHKTELKIKKQADKQIKREKNHGKRLGIDKIVIVNPYYENTDERRKNSVRYVASEENEIRYIDRLHSIAGKTGLEIEVLDSRNFSSNDVTKFNDYSQINNWLYEEVMHEQGIINSSRKAADRLAKKYGTKYFAWTFVHRARDTKESDIAYFFLYSITLYGLPVGLYYLIKPANHFYYTLYLVDIEKGEPVLEISHYLNESDNRDILNSYIYDAFYQIKTKKRK